MNGGLERARRHVSERDMDLLTSYLTGGLSPAERITIQSRLATEAPLQAARDAILQVWQTPVARTPMDDALEAPLPSEKDSPFDVDAAWQRFRVQAAEIDPERAALLPVELPRGTAPMIHEGVPEKRWSWRRIYDLWIYHRPRPGKFGTFLWFTLIILSVFLWAVNKANEPSRTPPSERATPLNAVTMLPLPDGSGVAAAPGSTLTTPEVIAGQRLSSVDFDGQGFFVIEGGNAPFTVRLPLHELAVRVEQTMSRVRFDVRAYQDDTVPRVLVTEGTVRVGRLSGDTTSVAVNAGQQVFISKTAVSSPRATRDTVMWPRGLHEYQSETLDQILRDMVHWYGASYRFFRAEQKGIRVTTSFTVGTPLDSIGPILMKATQIGVIVPTNSTNFVVTGVPVDP